MHAPMPRRHLVLWLLCASLVAAACGEFVERVTKPTPEETRQLALDCAEFDAITRHLEDVLDPLAEMREIVRREVLVESQRLGPLGRADQELTGLLLVQREAQQAMTRDSGSHRRAYEALGRSIQSWIIISEAFLRDGNAHDLDDEVGQSMAMLIRAGEYHNAVCGTTGSLQLTTGATRGINGR